MAKSQKNQQNGDNVMNKTSKKEDIMVSISKYLKREFAQTSQPLKMILNS
jgi:hypothetical protein